MTIPDLSERYARLYRYIQEDRLHTYPGSRARALADAALADVEALHASVRIVVGAQQVIAALAKAQEGKEA